MAIRTDIQINWALSPRQITVDAPSIELTMQDLLDTLRYEESRDTNIDNPSIVEGSGKVILDTDGNAVGLTVQLIDATVGFETRPGPNWIECALSGGNLSGLESDGVTVTVVVTHNNPYININKTSSVSATLSENKAIQFASFGDVITMDIDNVTGKATSGILFPAGTRQAPSDNFGDGYLIAEENGLSTFSIIGDVHLTDGLPDFEGYTFIGESANNSHFTIDSLVQVYRTEFQSASITGTLDGQSAIIGCIIENLNYVNGVIYSSILDGVITLGGNTIAYIVDSFSGVPGEGTPEINCGGSGQSLSLRNYNGGIKLLNKTGPESISVDLNSGQCILAATVTNGTVVCRGVGKLVDDNNEHIYSGMWNGVNIVNETINQETVGGTVDLSQVWDALLENHRIPKSFGDHVRRIKNQKV